MSNSAHAEPWPACFPRSFRRNYPRVLRGGGAWLYDERGSKYLDLAGSAGVSFIGHGDRAVAQNIADQLGRLEFAHTSMFTTSAAEELACDLLAFAGAPYRGGSVYFTSGGSEAVETALKLARQYQMEIGHGERFEVISRRQSYHGATLGAMAVSGNQRRRAQYLPMMREFRQINTPYCYRCPYRCADCAGAYAAELEQALEQTSGRAAAFICEPISGATLGAAVPPREYIRHIRRICDAHGILWIADEVMTGCGRTGRNFAAEHWQAAADIIVAGKGLGGGYAPLGAVIATRRVVEAIADGSGSFVHGLTYNAHPVAVAAGSAVLRRIKQAGLVGAADCARPGSVANAFSAALESLGECRSVGDVRGLGLLRGIEFVSHRDTKAPAKAGMAARVADAAQRKGVLVYPMQGCIDGSRGEHLLLAPPAVISNDQILWGTEQLRHAILDIEQQE
ncbi:MAG: aminotransferase class III-fold pyridoxal phosphate-dependent enzyme [Acidobacteria bacterium]|nr:aminotransferase class III-fold pyridoxal phosphate-dependent enzyme [Acidobacteriota bacterium]